MSDAASLWASLKDIARVVYPLEDFDYGMREFAINDNNGYLLQFGQPLDDGEALPQTASLVTVLAPLRGASRLDRGKLDSIVSNRAGQAGWRSLLGSQRHCRVHAEGAACRYVAGRDGGDNRHCRGDGKCGWIAGADIHPQSGLNHLHEPGCHE